MAEASHIVNFGSSTASGEARLTNIGSITAQTVALSLNEEPRRREVTPDSTCPFPRDDNFISREGVFEKLDKILAGSAEYRWAALYGLGGIGKSQIAIEYCYRTRDNDSSVWVFWMYASSVETVKQSFKAAAQRLDLTGYEDPKADIFRLLEQWLSEKHNGQWLLILDNADDADVLTSSDLLNDSTGSEQGRSILSYIPKRPHGRVLITSRDKKTASTLVPAHDSLIRVDHMNEKESLALLNSRIKDIAQEEGLAKELVSALDYVPLAVSQAGAYIEQQGELYSIEEYLEDFRASESNQTTLLNQQNEELRRDDQVPNSVILAWEISFHQLEKRNTDAVNLLYLISVLHRQNIPKELVRVYDTIETRNALAVLEAFSFISVSRPSQPLFSKDERILMLHRLIQLATKKWLEAQDGLTKWRATSLMRVSKLFPGNLRYKYWNHCNMLLPHAHEALQCDVSKDRDLEIHRGVLLENVARYDLELGNYDQAMSKATKCCQIYRLYCNYDDELMLQGMSTVAQTHLFQGHLKDAEQLFVQVVDTAKAKLGADHLDTVTFMASLASTYRKLGRWGEAEQLEVHVLEIRTAKLGADDLDTLDSMANLAITYWNQERPNEAEQLEVHLVETRKAKLGADHPATLISMHNLASTYWNQERWDESEQLSLQVLESRKAKLGTDHPATVASMQNLASTYWKQGRWDEAEQLFLQVLKISKAKFDVDHPNTLTSMNNLAFNYWDSGHDDQAIDLMREVVRKRTRKLGKDHPQTMNSQQALSYWEMNSRHVLTSEGS